MLVIVYLLTLSKDNTLSKESTFSDNNVKLDLFNKKMENFVNLAESENITDALSVLLSKLIATELIVSLNLHTKITSKIKS